MPKRASLGRGLAALLPDPTPLSWNGDSRVADSRDTTSPVQVQEISLDRIEDNPYQPRLRFDPEALAELADSIRQHGVLQPILVTRTPEGYQLVAGERRVQAARLAGLQAIPAQVRALDPRAILAIALVENVQRADLDPLEKARALHRLKDEFGATQAELGAEVGLSRPQVANLLRLLDLPEAVQTQVAEGTLSMGHAKVLLGLPAEDIAPYAVTCAREGWSVRELERGIAAGWIDGPPPVAEAPPERAGARKGRLAAAKDPDIAALERQLAENFGTPCAIRVSRKGAGSITLQFYSADDASRLVHRLLGVPAGRS